VENIADFLTFKFHENKEYSTINGYRSAISAIHPNIEGHPAGQHPTVKRLLEAVFNERPPNPRYQDTWDVGQVLNYIKKKGNNEQLNIADLTHKLTMLIALTSASRAAEIQGLDLRYMIDKGDVITFSLPTLTKTRKQGKKPEVISCREYEEDPDLDVTSCIRSYIARSVEWHNHKHTKLLLATTKPHKPVATCTISNWLKKLMTSAGIDTSLYKAHSTRAASTSKAKSQGVSVQTIVDTANWANANTFRRFYNKQVVKPSFEKAVLSK
jgi:hypothetical protein